jgi:hypothetical protein
MSLMHAYTCIAVIYDMGSAMHGGMRGMGVATEDG